MKDEFALWEERKLRVRERGWGYFQREVSEAYNF